MPVMDGFTATRILRQELKLTLPIVAMTAGVLEAERERSVTVGVTAFIPKPIEVEEMLAVLLRHLPKKTAAAPVPAPAALPPPARPPAAVRLVAAPVPAPAAGTVPGAGSEADIFNVDKLMRVMGKDAKGRAVMLKMVRGAIEGGMAPADEAGTAIAEGRLRDAARQFHGLRGAVGVLGARRLIQATMDAEDAIVKEDGAAIAAGYQAVRTELQATLHQAGAWLALQPD